MIMLFFYASHLFANTCQNFLTELIFQNRLQQAKSMASKIVNGAYKPKDTEAIFWQVASYEAPKSIDDMLKVIGKIREDNALAASMDTKLIYLYEYLQDSFGRFEVMEMDPLMSLSIYDKYPKHGMDSRLVSVLELLTGNVGFTLESFLGKYNPDQMYNKNLQLRIRLADASGFPLDDYSRYILWDALVNILVYEKDPSQVFSRFSSTGVNAIDYDAIEYKTAINDLMLYLELENNR